MLVFLVLLLLLPLLLLLQVDKAGERERLVGVFLTSLEESLARGGGTKDGVARLLDTAKQRLEQTQSEV